jgi:subtilase family serine protease
MSSPRSTAAIRLALVTAVVAAVGLPVVAEAAPAHWIRVDHHRTCAAGDRTSAGCESVRRDRSDGLTGSPMLNTATTGYTAAQLRTAYRITGSGSPSTVIAIVDAYDAPTVAADLAKYRTAMGLPTMDTACAVTGAAPSFAISTSASGSPCFVKTGQTGSTTTLPIGNTGWAQEIDLDVQMVSAVCPLCSILLVEGTSSGFADLTKAVTTASQFAGVRTISNSYSTAVGTDLSATSYPQYAGAAAKGIAVTVSTGDSGYGTSFPSTVPQVIAVGGTTMRLNADGSIASQSAWSGAGSGCSTYNTALAWQTTTATTAACGGRRPVADVSAVADPATGVSVYYNGAWYVFGGTSVSAPIVGAWLALDGGYSVTRSASQHVWSDLAWTDVTTGTNGTCTVAALCAGRTGWDGPTGLGTLPISTGVTPVAPAATALTYTGPTSGTHNVAITMSARLTRSGVAISGASISFTFNAKAYTAKTATTGVASVKVTLPSKAGSYTVTVKYAGSTAYAASTVSKVITVK